MQTVIAKEASSQPKLLFLLNRIDRIKSQVPLWAWVKFYIKPIWVDYRANATAAQYHLSEDWLLQNDYPKEQVKCVNIANIDKFVSWTKQNQPEILLHELAHLYHHQYLNDGYSSKMIQDYFQKAVTSKKYESVAYNLGGNQKAYALTNSMEYFAEMTESWFGKNEYYPYNQDDLKKYDPDSYELMSYIWSSGMAGYDTSGSSTNGLTLCGTVKVSNVVKQLYKGLQGGCYYINSGGNKRVVLYFN